VAEKESPWGARPAEPAPPPPPANEGSEAEAGEATGEAEHRFPCESCGAVLTFAPGSTVIKCEHCGHENAIPEDDTPIVEIDFRSTLASLETAAPHSDHRVVRCDSCGAEFSLPPDAHAGACPYCGSTVVTDTGKERQLKPAALVPFQLDQNAASDRLAQWLKGLWFAPSGVGRFSRNDGRFLGVYAPHWTFDAETASNYVGERGVYVQVPRMTTTMVNGKPQTRTVMMTETRWTRVRGFVRRTFDDVLVLASKNLPRHLAGKLFSWKLEQLVPYRDEYLSGFRSEAYQVGLEEGFQQAKAVMENQIRSDVMRDIGGNVQRVHRIDTKWGRISFKHVLLPIWVANYSFQGKTYNFVINGQTGELRGERPWSWIKIAIAVAIVAAIGIGAWLLTKK
jgi:LSD1 subclass zinc finger protein